MSNKIALAPFLEELGISRIFGDLVDMGVNLADPEMNYLHDMNAEDFAGLGLSAAEQGRLEDALGAQLLLRENKLQLRLGRLKQAVKRAEVRFQNGYKIRMKKRQQSTRDSKKAGISPAWAEEESMEFYTGETDLKPLQHEIDEIAEALQKRPADKTAIRMLRSEVLPLRRRAKQARKAISGQKMGYHTYEDGEALAKANLFLSGQTNDLKYTPDDGESKAAGLRRRRTRGRRTRRTRGRRTRGRRTRTR